MCVTEQAEACSPCIEGSFEDYPLELQAHFQDLVAESGGGGGDFCKDQEASMCGCVSRDRMLPDFAFFV